MKKFRAKKKNGLAEAEPKAPEKMTGELKNFQDSKAKEKELLRKPRINEKSPGAGFSKWMEKFQWIGKVKEFFREVRIELKKVTWPSQKETIAATGMVIVLSILVSFFLGLLDVGLAKLVSSLLKR
jgi:preprotein translocase subunit SecE